MENAETILVVILSTLLTIVLILMVVLLIKSVQIINQIQRITDKAEQVVDKAESIGEFFQNAKGSFAVGRLVSHIANSVFHHEESKGKGKRND